MTTDKLIGRQLDEYRIDTLLGLGNMARIYRATDIRLKRQVAIKIILSGFEHDADYVMRFEREAQAIARLDHPHIVRLYRYGEVEGILYMAMQYIEGASLAHVLASYRQDGEFIEPEEASRIVREIGTALDYAHGEGVIHRDVKPHNIMLDKKGKAILTDFGLVLLTTEGTRGEILGTPHYLAPEQAISSARAVPQSDLYSMGVILYEMFTGQRPFEAPNPIDVAMMQVTRTPRTPRELRPQLSPALEAVILKAMAKKPEDRYPSAAALADALDAALRPGAPARKRTPARRRSAPARAAETAPAPETEAVRPPRKTGGHKKAAGAAPTEETVPETRVVRPPRRTGGRKKATDAATEDAAPAAARRKPARSKAATTAEPAQEKKPASPRRRKTGRSAAKGEPQQTEPTPPRRRKARQAPPGETAPKAEQPAPSGRKRGRRKTPASREEAGEGETGA